MNAISNARPATADPPAVPYLLGDFVKGGAAAKGWSADAAAERKKVAPVWEGIYETVHAHGEGVFFFQGGAARRAGEPCCGCCRCGRPGSVGWQPGWLPLDDQSQQLNYATHQTSTDPDHLQHTPPDPDQTSATCRRPAPATCPTTLCGRASAYRGGRAHLAWNL